MFRSAITTIFKILSPITYGLAFAFILTPLVNSLEYFIIVPIYKAISKKSKNELSDFHVTTTNKGIRSISILITFLLIIFALYEMIHLILPQLVKSISNIVDSFDGYINNFYDWANGLFDLSSESGQFIVDSLTNSSDNIETFLSSTVLPQIQPILMNLSKGVVSFLSGFWNILLGLIFAIYLLGSKELFAGQSKKILYSFFSKDHANEIVRNIRYTGRTFNGFLSGKILDSLIIGMLCFIGVTLLNIPYPLLISVIIGVTNIIPFFGPYLGAIPSSLLILLVSPIHCLYFVIFILILQQIDGNVIGPKILGDSTGLSGFWVLFSITIFGGLFGVLGMLIGVPTFAVLYMLIRRFIHHMLKRKGMPTNTAEYMHVDYISDQDGFVALDLHAKKKVVKKKNFLYTFILWIKDLIVKLINKFKKSK